MANFSIGNAAGAGFRLIRRKPLAVIAWGLAYFVLAGVPAILILLALAPDFASLVQAAQHAQPGNDPDLSSFGALQTRMNLIQPVMFLSSIVGRAVLYTAVLRAVLEPQRGNFFYLRLGSEELLQGLLQICMAIMLGLVIALGVTAGLVAYLVTTLSARAAQASDPGLMALAAVLIGLLALGVVIWISLRLSMAGPMTFAEKSFRLFESWTITKGQAMRLFGLSLVLIAIVIGIAIVFDIVVLAGVLAFAPHVSEAGLKAFFSQPPQQLVQTLAPVALVAMLAGSVISSAFSAIFLAPWAEAYREIKGPAVAAS